jgi:hypothetical protein
MIDKENAEALNKVLHPRTEKERQRMIKKRLDRITVIKGEIQALRDQGPMTDGHNKKAVKASRWKSEQEQVSVRKFVEIACVTRGNYWCPVAELFREYESFRLQTTESLGTRKMHIRRFSDSLRKLGYERVKGRKGDFHGVYYFGLKLARDLDEPEQEEN